MSRNKDNYLILTGWGYTVYACAAALMYRALERKATILGVSKRKLPEFLANVSGYTHIIILGIGLVENPETLESALKGLKSAGVVVSWFSDRPLPAESKIDFSPYLDVHINTRGLMDAVCDVYPKLISHDYMRLELLAGLEPSCRTDGAMSSCTEIHLELDEPLLKEKEAENYYKRDFPPPDSDFSACCFLYSERLPKSFELSDSIPANNKRYPVASYQTATGALKKAQDKRDREFKKMSAGAVRTRSSASLSASANKDLSENLDVAEFRMLIAAAMYYYRNFRDTSVYSRVIEHLGNGKWHELTTEERKLVAWYKRFGSREIIGRSQVVESLRHSIEQIAGKDQLRVLIHGESGSGKENIAEQIHSRSSRQDECFLSFNCANVPDNLMESRLFGYEKGAFTGADTTTKGLFENANHGTLFLDEIGELSLECQGNLLRVLDNGRFLRVGGHEDVETDVRVICATNRNLAEMVRDGKFRMDLFYRLNVARIEAPALREHLEDLPDIANHRWKQLGHSPLTKKQLEVLCDYDYPGNVRELFNILDSADAFDCTDFSEMMNQHKQSVQPFADSLRRRNASSGISASSSNVEKPAEVSESSSSTDANTKTNVDTLDTVILKYVVRVFNDSGKNSKLASEHLGISFNTLKKHLANAKKMNIC